MQEVFCPKLYFFREIRDTLNDSQAKTDLHGAEYRVSRFFIDFQHILLRLIAVLEGNRADEHAGVL